VKSLIPLAVVAVLGLAACDGPYQKSGEKADAARGTREHIGEGPGEAAGRAIDKSLAEARNEMKSNADVMQAHAENVAAAIDNRADQLEAQADQLRHEAKRKAEAVKKAVEE
jgi:hypothetical protein